MFSFEQLRGFVTVAEELHFGRAAERLNMTQPPLSRQIQKLERSIGVTLLDRDNRRVELTAAGRAFLVEATRLLALADAAPDLARRIAEGTTGIVRVGFTAASTFGVLTDVLDRISVALPQIELDLYEMVTREQVEALLAHEIDLALARPPFDPDLFGSRLIRREELVVAVPAGHPLAALDRPVEVGDLAGVPLVMHSPTKARYFYDLVVGLLPVEHHNVAHTVSQVATMIWLVAAGRGVAFVPRSAARLGIDGVVHLPLRTREAKPVELHLLWPRDSTNPALPHALAALEELDPDG
ncbi:LysR family transcriptional regulator [Nocardioides zeae]|uniref:LysR family transcriptional regulator n=1 Tax=Nocardioides imazamoxiresistens TaxID=3231893 RepID=A0ABU3PS76_9ACTN|nr:LysR family transcriptional regulator [Nocardioides zeae]MDT9592089.1 LysR family transcriptional regulator [Nocardioides zeae]